MRFHTTLALLLSLFSLNGWAQGYADLSWIAFDEKAKTNWNFQDGKHQNWLDIQLSAQSKKRPHKVFIVVSKKSSSYQKALNQILSVFYDEGIAAQFTVAGINKQQTLLQNIIKHAESNQYDLILTLGSESMTFMSKIYKKGSIPVVTAINKDPVPLGLIDGYDSDPASNIAYTSLNIPPELIVSYFLKIKPNLKAVGLLYNKQHKGVRQSEIVPMDKIFTEKGIKVLHLGVSSAEKAMSEFEGSYVGFVERLKKVDPSLDDTMLWLSSSTSLFGSLSFIWKVSGRQLPLVSSVPNLVTGEAYSPVIGLGIDRRSNAHLAAKYAILILQKLKTTGELPVGVLTPPDIAINFSAAKATGTKIPFSIFENARIIYNTENRRIR